MRNNKAFNFNEQKAKQLETLKQYVPIVARVHGKSHPEFLDVNKTFNLIVKKINNSDLKTPEISEEFSMLRKITNNYTVPEDTCESYETVYTILAELDRDYHA